MPDEIFKVPVVGVALVKGGGSVSIEEMVVSSSKGIVFFPDKKTIGGELIAAVPVAGVSKVLARTEEDSAILELGYFIPQADFPRSEWKDALASAKARMSHTGVNP